MVLAAGALANRMNRMKAITRREVATTAQWAALGVSAGRLRQLVQTGDLVLLRRGVYARADSLASSAGDPARMHAFRVAAALLAAHALASASHESAAILQGLDLLQQPPESLVTLTRPPHARGSRVDIGGDQYIGRVDFCWRKYLTIAEADGMLKYADTRRAVAQLERDQLLREVGYKVVHFTWRQLFRETDRVIARICDAFARPSAL